MLVQMEGCDPSSAERRVLLVGATNRPEVLWQPAALHVWDICLQAAACTMHARCSMRRALQAAACAMHWRLQHAPCIAGCSMRHAL